MFLIFNVFKRFFINYFLEILWIKFGFRKLIFAFVIIENCEVQDYSNYKCYKWRYSYDFLFLLIFCSPDKTVLICGLIVICFILWFFKSEKFSYTFETFINNAWSLLLLLSRLICCRSIIICSLLLIVISLIVLQSVFLLTRSKLALLVISLKWEKVYHIILLLFQISDISLYRLLISLLYEYACFVASCLLLIFLCKNRRFTRILSWFLFFIFVNVAQ